MFYLNHHTWNSFFIQQLWNFCRNYLELHACLMRTSNIYHTSCNIYIGSNLFKGAGRGLKQEKSVVLILSVYVMLNFAPPPAHKNGWGGGLRKQAGLEMLATRHCCANIGQTLVQQYSSNSWSTGTVVGPMTHKRWFFSSGGNDGANRPCLPTLIELSSLTSEFFFKVFDP